MPNVVGEQQNAALAQLTAFGVDPNIGSCNTLNPGQRSGEVVGQSPPAGTAVDRAENVVIYVVSDLC
jgi:beta-lactam-binding protein with PASTA domain